MKNFDFDIVERLTYTLLANKEYKHALAQEKKKYKKLVKKLKKKQMKCFEEYFDAVSTTMAIMEELSYKQGVTDTMNLLGVKNE